MGRGLALRAALGRSTRATPYLHAVWCNAAQQYQQCGRNDAAGNSAEVRASKADLSRTPEHVGLVEWSGHALAPPPIETGNGRVMFRWVQRYRIAMSVLRPLIGQFHT
jgi:hypothetical protein